MSIAMRSVRLVQLIERRKFRPGRSGSGPAIPIWALYVTFGLYV